MMQISGMPFFIPITYSGGLTVLGKYEKAPYGGGTGLFIGITLVG
jgi:hypothetical protein